MRAERAVIRAAIATSPLTLAFLLFAIATREPHAPPLASATGDAPAWVGGETALKVGSGNPQTIAVAVPAGQAGDLLIAIVATDGDRAIVAPDGWTRLAASGTAANDRATLGLWYRLADGSEAASLAFTWSNNEEAAAAIVRYGGVDPASPIGPAVAATGRSKQAIAPSVDTTAANARVLRIYVADGAGFDETTTHPTGTTGRFQIDSGGSTGVGLLLADGVLASAGARARRPSTSRGCAGARSRSRCRRCLRPTATPRRSSSTRPGRPRMCTTRCRRRRRRRW